MNVTVSEKAEMSRKKGFSGSTLKIMALISMLVDHIAGVLILVGIYSKIIPYHGNATPDPSSKLYNIFILMRGIGRIAFPIFCFLLVEGYVHTSNKKKYALRLFIFALISEIPFNLAFGNKVFIPASRLNNVFFTLFLGVCVMYMIEFIENKKLNKIATVLAIIGTIAAFGLLANFIKCDFKYHGILCISFFYIFREKKVLQILSGFIIFLYEARLMFGMVYLSLVAIYFYNGKRGLKTKYFFYVFYPAHLLILYFIRVYLATTGI